MKKHEILSPQSRGALFEPPTDPAAIVRYYTFSPDDMALIRERRRAANRLGFAVQLAYFRHPGRIMRVDEEPPVDMLAFIASVSGRPPGYAGVGASVMLSCQGGESPTDVKS
jgi:TnpA family transposase